MNDSEQFKEQVELMIMKRINENHALEGFDMSLKLKKPNIEERCIEIIASSYFRDLLYNREKRNKLSEDTFFKLMKIHYETKKNSKFPDKYLQSKEILIIVKDYAQQNFGDEKIRKEKFENYLKLLLIINPDEDFENFKEFYDDESYHSEKFLKVHLEFFQAHLLKIDKQNQLLIDENKGLKEQHKIESTQILQENKEIKEKLERILSENEQLKSVSVKILDRNKELVIDLRGVKTQSTEIFKMNQDLKNEISAIKSSSKKILETNEHLKNELSILKPYLYYRIEYLENKLEVCKVQSTQLLQKNEELKSKLDIGILQNEELQKSVNELKCHLNDKMDFIIQNSEQIISQSSTLLDKISPLSQIQHKIIEIKDKMIPWLSLNQKSKTSTILYGQMFRGNFKSII